MDSPNNENLYDSNVHNDITKVSVVDTGVQLDLVDNSKSKVELIQTFPNNFIDNDMKMPITIQNCFPLNLQVSSELVVIANNGDSNFIGEPKIPLAPIQAVDANENLQKRFCIEQDGQTYVLSLQDQDVLSKIVDVRNKIIPSNEIQFIDVPKDYSLASKQGINQNWFTSRAEKNTLHNKGHIWKQGMWGKEETELLESNIKAYCEEHDVTNPATIIFEMAKDERKDFYRTIAKGLNRPLFSVYRRVIRMYDNKNHVGKYTSEELERLKKLRSLYGNNWQAIGTAMGRSASSIKDRCRLMKDNCNQGKWLPAEERRLAEAVYELADAYPGEKISSGLSWAVVAERVGTRSEKQCRTKWLNYLNWKEAGGTEWTREDDVVLICRVCNVNALDENHVDWAELAKGWSSVRSPQWLRGKWWNLKRHVPNAITVSFHEICDYLYKTFVLKMQVKDEQEEEEIDHDLAVQSSSIITQSKPTILHAIPGPAPPPAGIVVSTVPQTLTCPAPVISLPDVNTIGVETAHFPSVTTEPLLQTVEMIPQSVQLAPNSHTFLTGPHPAQTMPLATALASNQIIIHTVTADGIPSDGNIVHINTPSEIIIGPSSPVTLTSLASTQIPSAPSSPSGIQDHSLEDSDSVLMEDDTFENEDIEEQGIRVSKLDDDDDESEDICEDNPTAHIILADPMLTAGHSPEIGALEVENEKDAECLTTSKSKA